MPTGEESDWRSTEDLLTAFYDAHVRALSGTLRIRQGIKESRLMLREGRLVDARLEGFEGVPQEVQVAEYLVGCAGSVGARWRMNEGEVEADTGFCQESPVLVLLGSAMESGRRVEDVIDAYRGRLSHVTRLTGLGRVRTEGLQSLSMRALRYAERGQSLGRLVEHLKSGQAGRRNECWRSVDLLVQAGLFVLVPPTQQVGLKDEAIKEMPSVLGNEGEDDEKKAKELRAFAAELLTLHPLAALGLDPDEHEGQITVETVRASFRQMAARYHPDRIGSANDRVREAAADVFAVINEIHEQLEDPEVLARALREIRRKRQRGVATSELDLERARVMARLAEARMRKSNWKAARDLWVQAREMQPDPFFEMQETFCRAVLKEIPYDMAAKTLADIRFEKGSDSDRKIAGERVRREAERRFRVGWLHKLSGSEALAQPWFERTLEIQPEHTEALRELRLKRMREERAESESKSGGAFGGLFKWGKKKGGKS